jgi:hypothetical protein
VRNGTLRLSFTCTDPDGCAAASFRLSVPAKRRPPAFAMSIPVNAHASGIHVVTTRLALRMRHAVEHAGHRGLKVTIRRTPGGPAVTFTLIAKR